MPVEVLRQLKHTAIGLSRLVEHRADKLAFCPVGDSSSISHLLAALQDGEVQPSREEGPIEFMEEGPLPAAKEEAYPTYLTGLYHHIDHATTTRERFLPQGGEGDHSRPSTRRRPTREPFLPQGTSGCLPLG